jgi:hypothetical protein
VVRSILDATAALDLALKLVGTVSRLLKGPTT